ncbi:hypothetical protein HYV86_03755 [Candidatus Woesearchaeota archaeon]|nr:hypothetical protein [Candidatus Woesearchaeota archaeon]
MPLLANQSPIVLLEPHHEKDLLRELLRRLQEKNSLKFEELITLYTQTSPQKTIPCSIFNYNLHPAEALCKYLKENQHLTFQQIALLLNRNQKSMWATYQRAIKHRKQPFPLKEETFIIPLTLFSSRKKSVFENVVLYLTTTYQLSIPAIAQLLQSTPASIQVILTRARQKHD